MSEEKPQFDFSKPENQERLLGLPEEELIQKVEVKPFLDIKRNKESLWNNLSSGLAPDAEFFKFYPVPKEEFNSPELIQAAEEGFAMHIRRFDFDSATKFLKNFPLPEENRSAIIKQVFIACIIDSLRSSSNIYLKATELLKHFPLSEAEVQSATKLVLIYRLAHAYNSLELLEHFPLPESDVQAILGQRRRTLLTEGHISLALEFNRHFPLSETERTSPEFQAAAKQAIIITLTEDDIGYNNFQVFIKRFLLPESLVHDAVKQVLIEKFTKGNYSQASKFLERFPLPKEILIAAVVELPCNKFKQSAHVCDLTKTDFIDPKHKLFMELPRVQEVAMLEDEVVTDELIKAQGSARINTFYARCRENVWKQDVAGWYDAFVGQLGDDKSVANRYLEAACREGRSTHDALQFLPRLAEEYASDPDALRALIGAIGNPDDATRLAEHASSYAAARISEFGFVAAPRTLKDFIRVCILIKKNFRFPEGISNTIREKISLILDTVGDAEQLAEDLQDPDGRLIRLLENRDGLDEQALIQPIPEMSLRITSLGKVLQGALGSRELQKLQGTVGQLHKELGPTLAALQQETLGAEETRLRMTNAEVYARPKDNVELINLKKYHERYLESLRLVKGKGYEVTEDKGGAGKRLASMIERLPGYAEAKPEQKVQLRFERLVPLYEKLAGLLARERLGGTMPTDPVLVHLAGKLGERGGADEVIVQKPNESPLEFRERASEYAEQVLDEYLALARKAQQLGSASELYRRVEKLVLEENKAGGREAAKQFFADPDKYLATRPMLAGELENLLQAKGIDTGDTLVARVHAKSDARGIVCGDATNCCMPYGDYKNDDYMYRPDTAYFSVSLARDGAEHMVAQSVLVGGEPSDKKQSEAGAMRQWNTLAFDNVEVAHMYEKLVPEIAKIYKQVIAQCWQDKTLIMGTSYNDDRELVREMGELVRNSYRPINGELEYSDCFSHDTVVKLRGPVTEQAGGVRPRLGFVTPAMLERDSPLSGQLAANFRRDETDLELLRATLAPTQRVLRRDEENDSVL